MRAVLLLIAAIALSGCEFPRCPDVGPYATWDEPGLRARMTAINGSATLSDGSLLSVDVPPALQGGFPLFAPALEAAWGPARLTILGYQPENSEWQGHIYSMGPETLGVDPPPGIEVNEIRIEAIRFLSVLIPRNDAVVEKLADELLAGPVQSACAVGQPCQAPSGYYQTSHDVRIDAEALFDSRTWTPHPEPPGDHTGLHGQPALASGPWRLWFGAPPVQAHGVWDGVPFILVVDAHGHAYLDLWAGAVGDAEPGKERLRSTAQEALAALGVSNSSWTDYTEHAGDFQEVCAA